MNWFYRVVQKILKIKITADIANYEDTKDTGITKKLAKYVDSIIILYILSGSPMEEEARWKWKLDGSGSSMEVEARWKWKLDGRGSSMEVEAHWKSYIH